MTTRPLLDLPPIEGRNALFEPLRQTDELLTLAEHEIIKLLGQAASKFATDVIGWRKGEEMTDVQRDDLAEFVDKIHQLQHTVLAQAASRAYPHLYRPAGRVTWEEGK